MATVPPNPILAHETVRALPALSQKTFFSAAAGAGATFTWEFDLASRLTDAGQLLNTNPTPLGTDCTIGGGAGPQTTPQIAIGIFVDAVAWCTGAAGGSVGVLYSVDADPCTYRAMGTTAVPPLTLTNISGLRATGRFVKVTFVNITAGATVEFGIYIRNI